MKTKASIELSFIAGTSIEEAFAESQRIATILGCYCDFKFNSVKCCISADGDVTNGVEKYFKAQVSKDQKFKFVIA